LFLRPFLLRGLDMRRVLLSLLLLILEIHVSDLILLVIGGCVCRHVLKLILIAQYSILIRVVFL
jgi:hypothetical protein